MRLSRFVEILGDVAPLHYSEPWDNTGLLAGDPAQRVRRVLLTIDYTDAVAAEALQKRCDCVVAYHPPLFQPTRKLTATSLVYQAIRRGIAIYSPHTALDVAAGGTNDVLAEVLGLAATAPLRRFTSKPTRCKLIVFVPEEAVERVSQAIFKAGAGQIGQYSSCSFRSPGTGTFFGSESTNPRVGRKGRLEQVPELRLETVVPLPRLEAVLQAMRSAHPYEEPAFDLVPLASVPESLGLGRIGDFAPGTSRSAILRRIKRKLGLAHLLIAGPLDGAVRRGAVAAGACGDLLDDALSQKADLLLTGEMRHHDALRAARAGMTVICALHSNSERIALKSLQRRLVEKSPELTFFISTADCDPFVIV